MFQSLHEPKGGPELRFGAIGQRRKERGPGVIPGPRIMVTGEGFAGGTRLGKSGYQLPDQRPVSGRPTC
jgi:hypothetical protein